MYNNNQTTFTTEATRKEVKGIDGIMTCELTHHISKTTNSYKWTGPKFTQEQWWQMMAFFEWTENTAHSESQVRFYVNNRTKVFEIWAMPQRGGTNMASKELDDDPPHPRWAASAARFPTEEGWWLYGTSHHHRGGSAFQSGEDERNEKQVSGIHFTVGKIGSDHYDLDVRLYQSGFRIPLAALDDFWDVGDAAKKMFPKELHSQIAKFQMSIPPPAGYEFPQDWKDNYILPPPVVVSTPTYIAGPSTGVTRRDYTWDRDRDSKPSNTSFDKKKAGAQLYEWLKAKSEAGTLIYTGGQAIEDPYEFALAHCKRMKDSGIMTEICRLMWVHDLDTDAMCEAFEDYLVTELMEQAEKDAQEKARKDAQTNEGGPDGHSDVSGGNEWQSHVG